MKKQTPRLIAVAMSLGLAAMLAATPLWAAPPVVSFEDQAVLVTGATPGGSVVVFGVSQGFNGFTGYYLEDDELLVDDDRDGAVQLELDLPLSKRRSMWAVVDLASGELVLSTPEGDAPARADNLSIDALNAERNEVTVPVQRWAYALWVRPGLEVDAGAWVSIVGDGGTTDADGMENRQVQATVASFEPVAPDDTGEALPPERLSEGDLLLIVSPETLAISTTRIPAE